MSEYHYQYNGNGSNGSGNNDLFSWIVVIIALVVFWPIGLFLLFRKLMGTSSSSASRRANARRAGGTTYHYSAPGQQRSQQGQAGGATESAPTGATGSKSASGEYHYRYNYTSGASQQQAKAQADEVREKARAAAQQARAVAQEVAQDIKASFQATQAKNKAQAKRPAQAAPAQESPAQRAVKRKLPSGKGLTIAGGIVTGVFGLAFFSQLVDFVAELLAGNYWSFMLTDMAAIGGFLGVGLVLLFAGVGRRKKRRRFLQYLGLIGRRETVSISSLSKATRRSYNKVCDDLQDMLDCGVLPVGYLDLSNDRLVLSADGIADEPEEKEAAPEEPKRDDDAVLTEIREVNDQIADPVMSAKIDRIGEITGKILDYQRKNPNKAGQLRNFLSYYLPTTLKILRAYAQLEQQGIEGENISAAKARIEGMMDKVVEGFEKQLDKLFQNDALDITTDVAVLEKMLDNDGLGSDGFTMGMGG